LIMLSLLLSHISKSQWAMVDSGGMPKSFASDGKYIYVGFRGSPDKPKIFRSSDGGTSWENASSGVPAESYVRALRVSGNRIVAAAYPGVLISSDCGDSWMQTAFDGSLYGQVCDLLFVDSLIFAGSASSNEWHNPLIEQSGLFVSADSGRSWARSDSGMRDNSGLYPSVYAFARIGATLFAETDRGVFSSSNRGKTWDCDTIGSSSGVASFAVIDSTLFLSFGEVYLSSDMGATWRYCPAPFSPEYLAASGKNLLAGTGTHGVYLSTDMGESWKQVNEGLDSSSFLWHICSLAVIGDYVFAGTVYGLYRRPLSEITSVENGNIAFPKTCELNQNYPNPFNPGTAIRYQLSAFSQVSLRVYDVLGREVATLVNEKQNPGSHVVRFDGSRLASGVYFYRLSAPGINQTKKMLLTK